MKDQMTKNADKSAMPIFDKRGDTESYDKIGVMLDGLTKREQLCFTLGVADTGDQELDAIIHKANKQKFAGLAMQGILSGIPVNEIMPSTELAASHAVDYAKALLNQLEKGDE